MTVETLTPRVREALGVSASYDEQTIPAAIRRSIKRLLRDYNFPKTIRQTYWTTDREGPDAPSNNWLRVGQKQFAFPPGMKKELLLVYESMDFASSMPTFSEPLRKLEGFRLPNASGTDLAMYYWLVGTGFQIDRPLSALPMERLDLVLTYQSWDVVDNEAWMIEDFEDIIYFLTVYRTAAEMRKPDIMKAYAALWQEDMTSLAIYVNELEYDNLYMMQREATAPPPARYPI